MLNERNAREAAQRREQARKVMRRFAAAEGLEGIERNRRRSSEKVGLPIADRHAVLQRQSAIERGQRSTPLRPHADQREREALALVGKPDIARIAVGDRVEVALARDHRVVRQGHQRFARRRTRDARSVRGGRCKLASQIRGVRDAAVLVCHDRGHAHSAALGARRRAGGGQQFAARVDEVVEGFRVLRRRPASRRPARSGRWHRCDGHAAVERREARAGAPRARHGPRAASRRRQQLGDRFVGHGVVAIQRKRVRPPLRDPARGRIEERKPDHRADDAGVRQRIAVCAQVVRRPKPSSRTSTCRSRPWRSRARHAGSTALRAVAGPDRPRAVARASQRATRRACAPPRPV